MRNKDQDYYNTLPRSAPSFLAPVSPPSLHSMDSSLRSVPSSSLLLLSPRAFPWLQHGTLPLAAVLWDKNVPVGALHGLQWEGFALLWSCPQAARQYLPHHTFTGSCRGIPAPAAGSPALPVPLGLSGLFLTFFPSPPGSAALP